LTQQVQSHTMYLVEHSDIDALEIAVAGLNEGNLDPLVAMMADDMLWQGAPGGWLLGRRPS